MHSKLSRFRLLTLFSLLFFDKGHTQLILNMTHLQVLYNNGRSDRVFYKFYKQPSGTAIVCSDLKPWNVSSHLYILVNGVMSHQPKNDNITFTYYTGIPGTYINIKP